MNSEFASRRGQILILAVAAFVLVFLLWQSSSNVLYPFRLFVTFVHEAGHGLTAIATGGQFLHFEVSSNGSGVALTRGGSGFLVKQMGYLGAALFGAVLLYATNRVQRVNIVAAAVGLFFAGCAILFTGGGRIVLFVGAAGAVGLWLLADRISERSSTLRILSGVTVVLTLIIVQSEVALLVGIVGGALLIAVGVVASRPVIVFILNMLAFVTGFNAINDIWSLMNYRSASIGSTPNDALAMENAYHLPVEFWVILWTALAIAMMGASIYLALIRPGRRSARLPSN